MCVFSGIQCVFSVYSGEKSLVSVGIQDKSFLSIKKTWLGIIFSRKHHHWYAAEA